MTDAMKNLKQRLVLVVEDEDDIGRLIAYHLGKEGYSVLRAGSGPEALDYAYEHHPDLVILDIMLPEMDGLEVCRRLRSSERTASTPILILSARKEELDRVLGLELGADDYMIKPFSVRELMARVKAMLRRVEHFKATADSDSRSEEKVLRAGPITLYPERHQVMVDERACNLTHKEFVLLQLLMSNPGKVLTRELLLDRVWGYEVEVDTRTVDVHIRYLRQKVEPDPAHPRYIETVRGVGYRFSGKTEP